MDNNDIFIVWHIEESFISKQKKVPNEEEYIDIATSEAISKIISLSKHKKIIIALALEEKDNFSCLINCASNNFHISLDHSNASFKGVIKCYKHGVNRVTHLYNNMSSHNHREPGIIHAVFALNEFMLN